ncbi:MAG TPA: hypothetical protein V6C72_19290 [Chroococcales cyanobacterium]
MSTEPDSNYRRDVNEIIRRRDRSHQNYKILVAILLNAVFPYMGFGVLTAAGRKGLVLLIPLWFFEIIMHKVVHPFGLVLMFSVISTLICLIRQQIDSSANEDQHRLNDGVHERERLNFEIDANEPVSLRVSKDGTRVSFRENTSLRGELPSDSQYRVGPNDLHMRDLNRTEVDSSRTHAASAPLAKPSPVSPQQLVYEALTNSMSAAQQAATVAASAGTLLSGQSLDKVDDDVSDKLSASYMVPASDGNVENSSTAGASPSLSSTVEPVAFAPESVPPLAGLGSVNIDLGNVGSAGAALGLSQLGDALPNPSTGAGAPGYTFSSSNVGAGESAVEGKKCSKCGADLHGQFSFCLSCLSPV